MRDFIFLISPINIISDYILSLRDTNVTRSAVYIVFLIPAIISIIILVSSDFSVPKAFFNNTTTAFSIFVGMLINLLVLVYQNVIRTAQKILSLKKGTDEYGVAISLFKLQRSLFYGASFVILVSIAVVVLCLMHNLCDIVIFTFVLYLIGVFIISLVIILNRFHKTFQKDVNTVIDSHK